MQSLLNTPCAIAFLWFAAVQVVMLYIDCEVNKTPLKAFVDSGAQMTIISLEAAQKCGLSRLIDNRWSGIAKGVGTAKIVGRIHVAPLKVRSLPPARHRQPRHRLAGM